MENQVSLSRTASELDSSTSSPDSRTDMFKSGSIAFSEFDITSQAWEPVDFDLLPSPEGYDQPLADQETMGIFESKQSNAPTSKIRRRAQNRASQRAFRERKEKHVKGLESQLEALNERHQDLLVSYTKQATHAARLSAQIAQLQAQIKTLHSPGIEPEPQINESGQPLLPATFDAFAFPCASGVMLYEGDAVGLEEINPGDIMAKDGSDEQLPLFEDLLSIPG